MENKDLKILKKYYGEDFAHLARHLFPTLLEDSGLLSSTIYNYFAPTRKLYEMLVSEDRLEDFTRFIYSKSGKSLSGENIDSSKSAVELMKEAGYKLYPECKTEKDIQYFRKYYTVGEQICTFRDRRLNTCRVWFAVKKNAEKIDRDTFCNPKREDEYGTSVISIQFTKGPSSILSIKNRYNHSVKNPDATFSNNLDNIIPGLTDAFVRDYNINLEIKEEDFQLRHFVKSASTNKLHYYNIKSEYVYFCENNIMIDKFGERYFDKARYLLVDEYLFDFKNKTINTFDYNKDDSFIKAIGKIKDLKLFINKDKDKEIEIYPEKGEKIVVVAGKTNAMIKYSNPNQKYAGSGFLNLNENLVEIDLKNLKYAENDFLTNNQDLTIANLPNLQGAGYSFLFANNALKELSLPKLEFMAGKFLNWNEKLEKLEIPNVKYIGDTCLSLNKNLTELVLPKLKYVGKYFLFENNNIKKFIAPKLKYMGKAFLYSNSTLNEYDFSKLKKFESYSFNSSELCDEILKNAKEIRLSNNSDSEFYI